MRVVVGITGASGVQYAYRLLQRLVGQAVLIISEDGKKVIEAETEMNPTEFAALATAIFTNDDFDSPVASGSSPFDAVVVIPCSMHTLAKIALGLADNLITRAASVALKERRKLILVPRETPLHATHLEHMLKASKMGAIILPAMPAFYHMPKDIGELLDFIVGRVLDQLGIEHNLIRQWGSETRKPFTEQER
ncbi:MAG: UbiX family flavin prenyltransferase [Thermoplasmata archaeon]